MRVAAAGARQHRRHLLEPAAEAAPLAGGDLQQQPDPHPARAVVQVRQRVGGGVDAVLGAGAEVRARVQDHEVEPQLLGAQHLVVQGVAALVQDHRVAGAELMRYEACDIAGHPTAACSLRNSETSSGGNGLARHCGRRAGENLQRFAAVGAARGRWRVRARRRPIRALPATSLASIRASR